MKVRTRQCDRAPQHNKPQPGIGLQAGRIVLVVQDQGHGFDPTSVPPVGNLRADANGEDRFGGFGLHSVQSLADRVEIHSSSLGTTVRAEMKLTPDL